MEWTADKFTEGELYLEDDQLTDAKVEVTVSIPGRTLIKMMAREPGILAIVSRPDEDGIRVAIVEASGIRFVDTQNGVEQTQPAQKWALDLLGLT